MGTYHYHYKLIATPANPSIHIANYANTLIKLSKTLTVERLQIQRNLKA